MKVGIETQAPHTHTHTTEGTKRDIFHWIPETIRETGTMLLGERRGGF
jgi:hypothetical protein